MNCTPCDQASQFSLTFDRFVDVFSRYVHVCIIFEVFNKVVLVCAAAAIFVICLNELIDFHVFVFSNVPFCSC